MWMSESCPVNKKIVISRPGTDWLSHVFVYRSTDLSPPGGSEPAHPDGIPAHGGQLRPADLLRLLLRGVERGQQARRAAGATLGLAAGRRQSVPLTHAR